MKTAYILSPAAQNDIDEAAAAIADHWNDAAAEAFIGRIYDALEHLAAQPGLGHRRSDLTDLPVYFWNAFDRYAVIYRKGAPLEVVRVLAWKRDIPTLLPPNGSPRPR